MAAATLLGLAVLGGVPQARAQTLELLSNTDQTSSDPPLTVSESEYAQGFTTGSDEAGYILSGIELDVVTVPTSTSSLTVSLWSSNMEGLPDAVLQTLSHPGDLSTAGLKEFTAAADTDQRRVNALMHGQGPNRNQQGGRA